MATPQRRFLTPGTQIEPEVDPRVMAPGPLRDMFLKAGAGEDAERADRARAAEAAAMEREAARAQRAQAAAAEEAGREMEREAETRRRLDFKARGVETMVAPGGRAVPVLDAEGKVRYSKETGPVEWDKGTGKAFQTERDETGKVTQKFLDAGAELGANETDPRDAAVYRKNKFSPWDRIEPEAGLRNEDPAVRNAAAAHLRKMELGRLKREIDGLDIADDEGRANRERPSASEVKEARAYVGDVNAPAEVRKEKQAILDAEAEWSNRAARRAELRRESLALEGQDNETFAKGWLEKRAVTPADAARARGEELDARRGAMEEERKGLDKERAVLEEREKKGMTDEELTDVVQRKLDVARRGEELAAKAEAHAAEVARVNEWRKQREEDDAAAKARAEVTPPAVGRAEAPAVVDVGELTPAKEWHPSFGKQEIGGGVEYAGEDVGRVLRSSGLEGKDVYLKPSEERLKMMRRDGAERVARKDGWDKDYVVAEGYVPGGQDFMGWDAERARPAAAKVLEPVLKEAGALMKEREIFGKAADGLARSLAEDVRAGRMTPAEMAEVLGRRDGNFQADYGDRFMALAERAGEMRRLAHAGAVPVNRVVDVYRALGVEIKDVPPLREVLDAAGKDDPNDAVAQKARKESLLGYIAEYSDQPLFDPDGVTVKVSAQDEAVKGAVLRSMGIFAKAGHLAKTTGIGLMEAWAGTMQFKNELTGDDADVLAYEKDKRLMKEWRQDHGSLALGLPEGWKKYAISGVEGVLPSVAETVIYSGMGAVAGTAVNPGAGTAVGAGAGVFRGVSGAVTRFAARQLISAEAKALVAAAVKSGAKLSMETAMGRAKTKVMMGLAREAKAGVPGAMSQALVGQARVTFAGYGAGLASLRGNAGEYFDRMISGVPVEVLEANPELMREAMVKAMAYGLPAAALDVAGPLAGAEKTLAAAMGGAKVVRQTALRAGRRAVAGAMGDVGKEFLTGMGQGVLGVLAARDFAGRPLDAAFSEAEWQEVEENAVAEAAGGGAMVAGAKGIQAVKDLRARFVLRRATAGMKAAALRADGALTDVAGVAARMGASAEAVAAGEALSPAARSGDVAGYGRAIEVLEGRAQESLAERDWSGAARIRREQARLHDSRRMAAESHAVMAMEAAAELDARESAAVAGLQEAQASGDAAAVEQASLEVMAVKRAGAVARVAGGADVVTLTDGEVRALGYERQADGGVKPVKGVSPAVTRGAGGGWIITDEAIAEARRVSPAAAGLVGADERMARAKDAGRAVVEEGSQRTEGTNGTDGTAAVVQGKPGAAKAGGRRFAVTVAAPGGQESVVEVEAASEKAARAEVAARGVGMVGEVEEISGVGGSAPGSQVEVTVAKNGARGEPATSVPPMTAKADAVHATKPAGKSLPPAVQTVLEEILGVYGGAFGGGVRYQEGSANSGGMQYDPNDDSLVVYAGDLMESLKLAGDAPELLLGLVSEEVIHAVMVKLDAAKEIDVQGVWRMLPKSVQQMTRKAYGTTDEFQLAHEFLRMVMQGRVQFEAAGITVDGKVTEELYEPRLLERIKEIMEAVVRFLKGYRKELAKNPEAQRMVDEAIAKAEAVIKGLRGGDVSATGTAGGTPVVGDLANTQTQAGATPVPSTNAGGSASAESATIPPFPVADRGKTSPPAPISQETDVLAGKLSPAEYWKKIAEETQQNTGAEIAVVMHQRANGEWRSIGYSLNPNPIDRAGIGEFVAQLGAEAEKSVSGGPFMPGVTMLPVPAEAAPPAGENALILTFTPARKAPTASPASPAFIPLGQVGPDGTFEAANAARTRRMKFRVALVDLAEAGNSRGTKYQPREIERVERQAKVAELAAGWNPELAVPGASIEHGPIGVTREGGKVTVRSGHHREAALRMVYEAGGAAAEGQRAFLQGYLEYLGQPEEAAKVAGMKQPALAAEIVDFGDYAKEEDPLLSYVRDANPDTMSRPEEAIKKAGVLRQNAGVVDAVRLDEEGEFIEDGESGQAILRLIDLLGLRNQLTGDGRTTPALYEELRRAMLAYVLEADTAEGRAAGRGATLRQLLEDSGDNRTVNFTKALIRSAGVLAQIARVKPGFVGEAIAPAVQKYVTWKAEGGKGRFREFLEQGDFFESALPDVVTRIGLALDSANGVNALRAVLETVRDEEAYGQVDLFGLHPAPAEPVVDTVTPAAEPVREKVKKIKENTARAPEPVRKQVKKKVQEEIAAAALPADDKAVLNGEAEAIAPEGTPGEQALRRAFEGLFSQKVTGAPRGDFYSALERVVSAKMPARAPSALVAGLVQNAQNGVKAEELKWSGLLPWLAGQPSGPVSRETVLEFLRGEGAVRFEEVSRSNDTTGPPNQEMKERAEQYRAAADEMRAEADALYRRAVLEERADLRKQYEMADSRASRLEEAAFRAEMDAEKSRRLPPPKYGQYQLPGGENYREVVLAMPERKKTGLSVKVIAENMDGIDGRILVLIDESGREVSTREMTILSDSAYLERAASRIGKMDSYTSGHFTDVPNYVAHMRLNERADAEGKPGLFMEELQSDRHQAGREKGYQQPFEEWLAYYETPDGKEVPVGYGRSDQQARSTVESGWEKHVTIKTRKTGEGVEGAVPPAPFEKTWPLQMFKRALRDAVAAGKEWIGWTTGETQAERFDLSKQVDSVSYRKDGDRYSFSVDRGESTVMSEEYVPRQRVVDVLGKEIAEKMDKGHGSSLDRRLYVLRGLDLKVGGEGMKGFYDNILPKEIGRYVKQWGGQVGKGRISDDRSPQQDRYSQRWFFEQDGPSFESKGQAIIHALNNGIPIWRVEITPAMRAAVREQGQALFSQKVTGPTYRRGIPVEKQGAMLDAARALIGEGVNTPEGMARKLTAISPNLRQYSEALWRIFGSVDPELPGTADWAGIYERMDGRKAPSVYDRAKKDLESPAVLKIGFKPTAERFAQFYRDYGIPESAAVKNGAGLMMAIETGEWTDLLHPDNERGRAIWAAWAGAKLPRGVAASKEAFRAFIANFNKQKNGLALETQTDASIEAERKRQADAAMRKGQQAALEQGAAAPLTGTDTTGQGALFADDPANDLFSGPSAEDVLAGLKEKQRANGMIADDRLDGQIRDLEAALGAEAAERGSAPPQRRASDAILAVLREQRAFDWRELLRLTDAAWGGTVAAGAYTFKDAYDAMELAVNRYLEERAVNPAGMAETEARLMVRGLEEMQQWLPTQTRRTAESDQLQQFSTPPALAFVASWVANVRPGDVMLEPSAGIGGLGVFAKNAGARVVANEFSERRRKFLAEMGFETVMGENAEQLHAILEPKIKAGAVPRPTVVVMNPPFSNGAESGVKRDTRIGAKHVEEALKLLPAGGRLVAIVGEGMGPDTTTFRAWFERMKRDYSLRANVWMDGKNYAKYGTTFSNRLLVFDKMPQAGEAVQGEVANLVDLITLLRGIRDDRPITTSAEQAGAGAAATTAPGTGGAVGAAGDRAGGGRAGRGRSGTGGTGRTGSNAAAGNDNAGGTDPAGTDGGPVAGSEVGSTAVVPVAGPAFTVGSVAAEAAVVEDGSVFASYRPSKVRIPGAKAHPADLVESAAMASVEAPDPTYTPNLPSNVVTEGLLSEVQLENVVYAGQAHAQMLPEGMRRGYFIGDGTGVGKGRQIAGIIMDNWRQGRRRAVWVSKSKKLIEDARRDAEDLGLDPRKIVAPPAAGKDAETAEGVMFMTYATLRQKHVDGGIRDMEKWQEETLGRAKPESRIEQMVRWLGKDFDGVIAFDEAHQAGNAVAVKGKRGFKKPSTQGIAVVDLQRALPLARIVYVSATGATEVTNLSYGERLGLWGVNTPFPNKMDFFQKVAAGGISAMEIVARDMKALGSYLARSISFRGVEFDRLTQELTPEQTGVYNELARGWQMVLANMDEALAQTGGSRNARARSAMASAFWGAQQRFFNTLLTAMEIPALIGKMEERMAAGESAVLQLVNTNEAQQERALGKATTEAEDEDANLEDLDLSPKDILLNLINQSFPVVQYVQMPDPNNPERTIWVQARDSEGNPVLNPAAVAAKEDMLTKVALLPVPDGALEQVLDHFGAASVAEITGRTRRLVRDKEGARKIESRSDAKRQVEAKEFQGGKRRILIFSDAGGTGFSFHADRRAQNQQRRAHFLVQAGWRADNALQGFGRTHRSNQVQAPFYYLVETNIKGHRRFLSTIARRLSQLGALTAGERKASGGGMFKETDNLESEYAGDALTRLVHDVFNGKVEGWNIDRFADVLGFAKSDMDQNSGETRRVNKLIDPETGALVEEKIPGVPQFLNRLLALELHDQNELFDAFDERMQRRIERAMEDGSYDPGTQEYKAKRMEVTKDEVVYEHPGSTARTRIVEVEAVADVDFTSFDDVLGMFPDKAAEMKFVRNVKSGRVYATLPGRDVTNKQTGAVTPGVKRIPTHGEITTVEAGDFSPKPLKPFVDRSGGRIYAGDDVEFAAFGNLYNVQGVRGSKTHNYDVVYGLSKLTGKEEEYPLMSVAKITPGPRVAPSAWEYLSSNEARAAWAAEIKATPAESRKKEVFIVGALLPIWDRLQQSRPKIYRFTATDGKGYLGVLVPSKDVPGVRARLGARNSIDGTVAYGLAMQEGQRLELANGWAVQRVTVAGERRLEVTGLGSNDVEQFLNYIGGMREIKDFRPRFFLPAGEAGPAAMGRLLERSPAVKVGSDVLNARSFTALLKQAGVNLDELGEATERARLEKPGERTVGRPELSLGALDPVIMGLDAVREPGEESFAQWDEEARAMLKRDYEGTVQMLEKRGQMRGTEAMLNPVETRAAQLIVARESRKKMTRTQERRLQWLVYAYRNSGTEQARGLASRRDPFMTRAERHREFLMRVIYTPTAEARRKLEAAESFEEREKVMIQQANEIERVKRELARMGVTLDDIFRGEVRMTMVASPLAQQVIRAMGDGARGRAAVMLQTDHRGEGSPAKVYARVAKETGLKLNEVAALHEQMLAEATRRTEAAIMARLMAAQRAREGLKAQRVTGEETVIPVDELLAMDPAARAAAVKELAARLVEQMGFLPKAKLGKMKKVKRKVKRKPLFEVGSLKDKGERIKGGAVQAEMELPGAGETERGGDGEMGGAGAVLPPEGGDPTADAEFEAFKKKPVGRTPFGVQPRLEGTTPEADESMAGSATAWGKELWPDAPVWQGEMLVPVGADMSSMGDVVGLARAVSIARATPLDMLTEYWINNLLSGPATHVRNLAGNVTSLGVSKTLVRGVETLLRGQPAEMVHLWKGLMPGLARGWRLAKMAWAHEADFFHNDVLNAEVEFDGLVKGEGTQAAIPGKTGRVIRVPGRFLAFTDALFKGLIGQMEAGAQAYRIAKSEGLSGEALTKRMNGLLNTPGSQAWQLAVEKAEEATFQSKLRRMADYDGKAAGPVSYAARGMEAGARAVSDFANSFKLMKFIVPFIRTPYNILRTGIRMSPAGSLVLAEELISGGWARYKNGVPMTTTHPQMVQHAAEQIIAWTAAALLAGAVEGGDDDDDQWLLITGTRKKGAEGDLQDRTHPPLSIRIGGQWLPYGTLEPVATTLGVFADAVRNYKTGSGSIVASLRGQIEGKTFLKGLDEAWNNAERMAEGKLDTKGAALKLALTALVPNLMRQPVRAADDYERDWKQRDWWYDALPLGSGAAPVGNPVTGEPVEKPGNVVTRLLFPFLSNPPAVMADADRMVMEYNRLNPDDRWAPPEPERKIRIAGADGKMSREVELSREALEYYQRRSAGLAKPLLPGYRKNVDVGTRDAIKEAFEKGREMARDELRRWPLARLGVVKE